MSTLFADIITAPRALGPPDAYGEQGADMSPPWMLTWRLFPRVNQSREQIKLLVCWKAIGIQTNDLSVYNSFQRISHGRGERGAMLLETYRSIVPSVSSPCISAYRAATQTPLTWEL